MRSGCIYGLPTSALPTSAIASSSWPTTRVSRGGYSRDHGDPGNQRPTLEGASQAWPTPNAQEYGAGASLQARREKYQEKYGNNGFGLTLNQKVQGWPSPRAEDSESAGNHPKATDSLTGATKDWPTPQAHDRTEHGPTLTDGHRRPSDLSNVSQAWSVPGELIQCLGCLQKWRVQEWPARCPQCGSTDLDTLMIEPTLGPRKGQWFDFNTQTWQPAEDPRQWSTPNVPNRGPEARQSKQKRGASGSEDLQTQVNQWGTPRAAEWKESGPEGSASHEHRLERHYLDAQALSFRPSRPDRPTPMPGEPSSSSGPTSRPPLVRPRLNPRFVEWLMGWPIGHTML